MLDLAEKSITIFERMPRHIESAEYYLDRAERDFKEGAFAPFWDSIEASANSLGDFNECVYKVKMNASRYTELIKLSTNSPPRFPIAINSVSKLDIGTGTTKHMASIVRTAQCNFQFVTIYEQRKTNQILVAGFTNLGQALAGMTSLITSSIYSLSNSVREMASTLEESTRAANSRQETIIEAIVQSQEESSRAINFHQEAILEATNRSQEEFSAIASEQAKREEKALEMLDNIQRRARTVILVQRFIVLVVKEDRGCRVLDLVTFRSG